MAHQDILDSISNRILSQHAEQTRKQRIVESPGLEWVPPDERDVVLAEPKVKCEVPRDVSKDVKIKRSKDTSRPGVEEVTKQPSRSAGEERGCNNPLTAKATAVGHEVVDVDSPPRDVSSRAYSGISVQHCRTDRGIRLAITLQTPEQARSGVVTLLTAELKRYDRLREIKTRPEVDSDWFTDHLQTTIDMIRDAGDTSVCLGRIHARGKRSAWYQDCFVVGLLEDGRVVTVILNLEGDEYQIDLELGLTERQLQNYLTGGIWGHLKQARAVAPRLADAPSIRFGG